MAASRNSIVLLSCGSFNPVTSMHLKMFEIAKEALTKTGLYSVVKGIMSPVHDGYKKKGLVKAEHRIEMCRLALRNSDWVHADAWECNQSGWTRTAEVLDHMTQLAKEQHQGPNPVVVKLLCGSDLLETFAVPNLWSDKHIKQIVGEHGLVVIPRSGSDAEAFISSSDHLREHRENIFIVKDWTPNDMSATKIRKAFAQRESVKGLIPDDVIKYVATHNLYQASSS